MANYFERYLSDEEKKRWASDSPNFQHFDQVAGTDHPGGGKVPTDPRIPDSYYGNQSIGNPAPMSIWDRIKEDASDVAQHYSPAALFARYVTGITPNAEDYRPNDTRTPDQVKAERQARVAADEREFRAQDQLRHEGDPAIRPDGSTLGNAARFGARAVGQFAGGMISDPTNIIAPGESWIMKMLGQAGIGAGVDALMQGGEMKQGVRDEFSPLETGISAAAGPAMVGTAELAHRLPGAANALRDWWRGRGVDTTHLNDADLVSGSLDGGVDPNVRMGPQDIQEVLQRAGASADQFSTPEMAARAAGRVQDITPPLNTDPAELARQAALRGDIEAGTTDPSFAPQLPPRVMPDNVPIISAPGGLNARADDLGAMQGFDRQRFADAAALARGRIAGEQDPTMHAIVNDPSANQQQKIASIWERLQRQAEGDQANIDHALTLPEQPLTPWQASTPDRAIGEGVGAGLPRMVDITRATESGGHRYGQDGQLLRSPKGALGEMQVMPGTNRDPGFGVRAAQNSSSEELARVGRDYLKAMQDRYGGDPAKAWAAYNAGPGAVDKALRHGDEWLAHLPAETQAYVSKNMKQLGAAPPPYRMAAPDGDTIHGQYSSPDRVQRNYDDPKAGPVREDFQGFERTEKPASPTNEQLAGGDIYRRRGSEIFTDDRRGQAFEPRTQTGDSTRPFKAVADDPEGQPGYWEQRAQGMHEEAFAKAQADLEQEWARRAEAAAERASRTSGKTRFEEERTAGPDPASRYGSSGYGQKPHQDGGTWRTTAEGHIADKDGKPVAFRNAKEAATWAARNQMGGDFELGSWGTNSKRIVLKRRANSAYGSAPERPTPGAGPVEPPAGRTADASQRALGAPESASETPRSSGTGEPPIAAERSPQPEERSYTPPPPAEPAPRPEIPPESRAPIAGKAEQVVTPRGRSVDTQFEVREARDLVSSDHPAYDPALQPRDRANRSSSDAQVAEIASKLDPEQLHSSRLASQGAPIVGPDRMVESGNGRVQAIRRAYDQHPEKMDAYKGMIRDQGLDPSGFDQPVLVRKRTTDLGGEDRGAFVREANERDTMQMSSPEQAKADAGALSDDVLSLHRGGAVTDAGNRDFVRAWVDKVASPAERNTLMQADGSLSQDGIRRVRSSLLAKAYDDADLVSRITEDPDTNIKAIGSALTDTAPGFAQLRQKVAAGELPKEFDIGKNVGEMASMISRARSEGKPLADMVKQDDIFAGRTNPTIEALTRLMFKGEDLRQPRSAADMQEGLRFYTQEAAKAKSGSLFGDEAPAAKPVDILKAAAAKLDKKAADRSGKGATLFRRATEAIADDRGEHYRLADQLDHIATSHENVAFRNLARRLSTLVGDAHVRFGEVDREGLGAGEHAKGRTDAYADGRVESQVHSPDDAETTLHEAIHVATLSKYGDLLDKAKAGDKEAAAAIAELEQLRTRAQKAFERRPDDPTGTIRYALENTDEFLAHGLTSKPFQEFLKRFQTANLWSRFRDWVRRTLGAETGSDTLLDRTLQAGSRLVDSLGEKGQHEGGRATLFSKDPESLDRLLDDSKDRGNKRMVVDLGEAPKWLVDHAAKAGLDIDGFNHVVDNYAVNHVRKQHGDPTVERNRGQVEITDDDFRAVPGILKDPDKVAFGTKSKIGREQIVYLKRMDDGSMLVVEEVRTGRHQLALNSMRKYPPATNADSILSTLHPNARSNREDVPHIIQQPKPDKSLFSKERENGHDTHSDEKGGIVGRVIDTVLDVDGLKGDAGKLRAKIGSPVKTAKTVLRELDRFGSAAGYSADGALRTLSRHFDSPTIAKLADTFQARAGKGDATGRTYDEALKRGLGRFRSKLDDALEPHIGDKAALTRIRDLLADPSGRKSFKPAEREAAVKVRDLLKDVLDYRREAGEDLGEAKNYFPRVLDAAAVAKNPKAFTAAAERLYRTVGADDAKGAADAWLLRVLDTHAGVDGGLDHASGVKPNSAKAREFGAEADRVLGDFYQKDPMLVLSDYITGSIRRAEETRRFGAKGAVGSAEREAWMKAHGDKSQWDVMREQIREELRASGEDGTGVMDRVAGIKDSNMGKLTPLGARASATVSMIHAWNQLASLERVTFSSLGDLAMGFVRGGARYGVRHLAKSLAETAQAITPWVDKSPSDARRWAESLGTVGSNTATALIQSRMDAAPGARAGVYKLMDQFYSKVGIKQLTEGGRTASTENGRIFVETLAGDLTSDSARVKSRANLYLRELGVADPKAFGEWLRKGAPTAADLAADKGHAADYATAVIRFADQSVLMPTRAQRPTWANHPVGSLLFALQSYNAGFTQNVLKRVGRLAVEGAKSGDPKLLAPAAGMVALAGMTVLQDYLRGAIFGQSKSQQEASGTDYAMRIADRMGMTGVLSPFFNGLNGLRYHRSMSQSLQGAVLGRAADAADATAGLFIANKDTSNAAERKAAAMLYDLTINPALNAFGAGRAKGALGTAIIFASGNRKGGALPADRDEFVDEFGGEKPDSDGDE